MLFEDFRREINSIDSMDFGHFYIDENATIELQHFPVDANPEYDICDSVSFTLILNGNKYHYWTGMDYNSLYGDDIEIRKMYDEIKSMIVLERDRIDKILSFFE